MGTKTKIVSDDGKLIQPAADEALVELTERLLATSEANSMIRPGGPVKGVRLSADEVVIAGHACRLLLKAWREQREAGK